MHLFSKPSKIDSNKGMLFHLLCLQMMGLRKKNLKDADLQFLAHGQYVGEGFEQPGLVQPQQ